MGASCKKLKPLLACSISRFELATRAKTAGKESDAYK